MTKISGTRLRPGDVLKVECGSKLGFLGYLGRHAHFGDAVLVLPDLFSEAPRDLCSHFNEAGYFQFYPATTAARHKLATKVTFCAEAMRALPVRWRNIINSNADGTVRSWLVCDGVGYEPRDHLSIEEHTLPIGEIINHELLLQRLREGWTPSRYDASNV
jgi:hypothetical protein